MRKVYTIKDAARALGIHPKTIRRWEEKGKFIPRRTLGNQRRFDDSDIKLLAKIKSGEPVALPPPRWLSLSQAASKLRVSPVTLERWTRAGKLKLRVNDQLQPGYSETELNLLLKNSTLPADFTSEVKEVPIPEVKASPAPTDLIGKYAGPAGLLASLAVIGYLWLLPKPFASPAVFEAQPQTVDLALPRTAQFFDGRITLGLDSGDLFYADSAGNIYAKNTAVVNQAVYTRALQLIPAQRPQENQIGQLYVDQGSGNLRYFDGLEWINLNKNASQSGITSLSPTSYFASDEDISLTLGALNASASAASLRITLAGDQSVVKILGGADQDLLTINDNALNPILLSQPTQILGNLTVTKLIDQDQNTYFLDPSAADISLAVAGDASLSGRLSFNLYGDYLSNSVDDYLVFSGGMGVGGSTNYGFSSGQNLNTRSANVENELTVSGRMAIGTSTSGSYKLNISGDVYVDGEITADAFNPPDYVFEPDYRLLTPAELRQFVSVNKHLPGVPSAGEIEQNGLNLKQLLLALLEKTEENTLYILDLYDRSGRIVAPTVDTQILTTDIISPLAGETVTISGNASISGTLYAREIESTTIERLREKISQIAGSLNQETAAAPPAIPASEGTEVFTSEADLIASDSGHLSLASVEAGAAFFKDYLAVLGQATFTDVKINHTLSLASVEALNGSLSFLSGLMTLNDAGQVIINGSLAVTGPIVATQIKPFPDQELAVNIATGSALSIYSDITPLATFSGQTVALANLRLEASGTATVSAGANHAQISAGQITAASQVIVTFTSDYTPATKYWVKKDPDAGSFTIFTNYPVNLDTTLDWLIIN